MPKPIIALLIAGALLSHDAYSSRGKKYFQFCDKLLQLIWKPHFLAGNRIISSRPYPFRSGQGQGVNNFGFVRLKTNKGTLALKLPHGEIGPDEIIIQNEMAQNGFAPRAEIVSVAELTEIKTLLPPSARSALDHGKLSHGVLMEDLGETWDPYPDDITPAWAKALDKEHIKRQVSLIAEVLRQNEIRVFEFQIAVTRSGKVFMVDFYHFRRAQTDIEKREPLDRHERDILKWIDFRFQ